MLEIILIAVIVLQTVIHFFERRDMYDRLMSKNLSDYKTSGTPPHHIPSAHNRTLNRWRSKVGDE